MKYCKPFSLPLVIAIAVAVMVSLGFFSFRPAKDSKGLCKVSKINGKEVYIMNEPVSEYEVISSAKTGLKATSLLTGGIVNESIADKVAQFVKKAQQNYPGLDGVVYNAGKEIGAFKWEGKPAAGKKGMAMAGKIDGHLVFVLAEPEAEYETLGSVTGGTKWKSLATGGIVNNSIEDDMAKYMKRALDQTPGLDAIIYSSGKSVVAIKFND